MHIRKTRAQVCDVIMRFCKEAAKILSRRVLMAYLPKIFIVSFPAVKVWMRKIKLALDIQDGMLKKWSETNRRPVLQWSAAVTVHLKLRNTLKSQLS